MHCAHRTLCLAGGLLSAFLGGCYAYNPYGSSGMPRMYGGPSPGVVVPGAQPAPFFQPGPTLPPQGVPPGQPQTLQSPASGDAQIWDPAGHPNPVPANPGMVPNYGDPQNLQGPGSAPSGPGAMNIRPNAPTSYNQGALDNPPQPTVVPVAAVNDTARDEFQPPQKLAETEEPVLFEPPPTGVAGRNPYDYERKSYRWLRGTVEYDESSRSWHMMYNPKPDDKDKYGGEIALIPSDALTRLSSKDVVLIEGIVDNESRDSLGKPKYRVERVLKLKPDQPEQSQKP